MKVVIINPPNIKNFQANRDLMGGFGCASMKSIIVNPPPINSLYVASILKKNNNVYYIDCAALDLDKKQLISKISNIRPEIAIITVGSATYDNDLNIVSEIKNKFDIICMIIGPQGAASPEYALKNSSVDIVVRGEPELIVKELVEKINNNYYGIKGISYKINDKIIHNKERALITNLDILPYPAWERLPINRYCYQNPKDTPHLAILSSRGCPFSCIYCPYPVSQGIRLRLRKPEEVVNEIKYLIYKFKVKSIMFRDPCFTANKEHAYKICRLIIENKLKIKWWCETSTGTVDDELLKIMSESGCKGINFGVESGNINFIAQYARKTGGAEKIISAFGLCKKYGIETTAFFILGLPGETKKTIKETINLAIKLEPDYIDFHCAAPYPGTKLYSILKEKGKLEEKYFKNLTGHTAFSSTENMPKEELRRYVNLGYKKFYRRPSRIIYELRKRPLRFIQRSFGYLKFRKIN